MGQRDDRGDVFKIPHDVVAEQVVLAAGMTDADALQHLASRIRPEHFVDRDHAMAWAAIIRCKAQQHEPTPIAIEKLSGGKVERKYLEDVIAANPKAPKNLGFYIDSLMWDITRAKAVQGPISELLKALQDPGTNPDRVRALARQIPVSFQGSSTRVYLRDGPRLVAEHKATLRKRMEGLALFPTGIEGLDFYPPNSMDDNGNDVSGEPLLIPGVEPKYITTVTAISGGGKSTFVAYMALMQARIRAEVGRGKVLYGAWEMEPEDVLELMACISTGISRSRVRTGRITDHELNLLYNTMDAIKEWVLFVDMPFGRQQGAKYSHDDVLDVVHGYIADSGADFVIFDLWLRAFKRMEKESDISDALTRQQAIVKETGCHCVLVQQQRLKDIETRQNPAPTREGIKGSSAWVDVSDTILGVYLPGLMKRMSRNVIQILVLKQRYGLWPLVLEYVWDGDLVKLSSPQLVWDMAIGDERRVQSGGASSKPAKKKKVLAKVTNPKGSKK